MKINHNKKRNVGIIYEMLLKYISINLVEGNQDKVALAKNILKKHYRKGTEMYKEHKLFEALLRTKDTPESVASKILESAKTAARNHDGQKLHAEKSKLIKEINYKLSKESFYKQKIEDYRNYATIQTALNLWRKPHIDDVQKLVTVEVKIHEMLTQNENVSNVEDLKTPNVNNLSVKIMMEKFNSRYSSVLNEDQQSIIKSYIFSKGNDDYILEMSKRIKKEAIKEIKFYMNENKNPTLKNNYSKVLNNLSNFNIVEVNDDLIGKILTVSKLRQEILEN